MYSALVPITMFGWIFVTIGLFFLLSPQKAVTISVIIGFLFLPAATYDFSGFPTYNKVTSISIGLLLGGILSGKRARYPLKLKSLDLPIILWCFVVPYATSFSNHLGLQHAVATMIQNYLSWGVIFWSGRRYFVDAGSLRILLRNIVTGGLLYIPLVFFEVRMSPQLSNIFYGFFPHSFLQHFRYGGYRPIVFLQHGLMVSLWMAVTTTVTYWLWRSGEIRKIIRIPVPLLILAFVAATLLCRSGNGWVFLVAGIIAYSVYRFSESPGIFRIFLLIIPLYMIFRLFNIIPVEFIERLADLIFDDERVSSLTVRLLQENLFGTHALERPLFGWGGYGRGWPVNPETGELLIQMVDSLWVIFFSTYGLLGIFSAFLGLGIGPWKVLGLYKKINKLGLQDKDMYSVDAVILSLIIIFFLLDSLLNAMVNPVYILCAGVLINHYLDIKSYLNECFIQDAGEQL